ncbi:MAG: hypothetical protein ABIO50_08690 [Nitrosospira sp.]
MMARQVARQFCRLREVHSLVYGRRAGSKNGRKLTASTRAGSQSRLMNYPGSYPGKLYAILDPDYDRNCRCVIVWHNLPAVIHLGPG